MGGGHAPRPLKVVRALQRHKNLTSGAFRNISATLQNCRKRWGLLFVLWKVLLFFIFSRDLLDTVTIVDDNPSTRSSGLQLSATIKKRSKVHFWLSGPLSVY